MQRNKTETKDNAHQFMAKLPQDPSEKAQLVEAIESCAKRLSQANEQINDQDLSTKIQKLRMRTVLIDGCAEMSILRLEHLQQIFKHYCTHIFKTGKHMTFDRLEYERVHLTMDRFFLFLKDFELTLMRSSEKKEEVLDKNAIITVFKKISSNCRDLSFEQFIQCIEKIAVMYYDEKQVFYIKKQKQKEQKVKRKQQMERRQKLREKRKAKQLEQQKQNEQEGEQKEQIDHQGENDDPQKEEEGEEEAKEGEQNDELVKDMMNDKDLEDPNEQINQISNRYALQKAMEEEQDNEIETPTDRKKKNKYEDLDDQLLLILTNEEKIEYFYQFMIKVDSVSDYRIKLTALNLPIFQKGRNKIKPANKSESKIGKLSQDQSSRMEELKKKMEQKKLKQKEIPLPKPRTPKKDDDERRKKRQLKKQREEKAKQKNKKQSDALLQKKIDSQRSGKEKKPEYNEKQVDWESLTKLSIDQLKLKQFNPNRYFSKDDDDGIFLGQYDGGRQRIASGMGIRDRNSIIVLNDMKKRVGQVQQKQQRQELDYQKRMAYNKMSLKNKF